MTDSDLERVLVWRNHPSVRMFMYSRQEITRDEHRIWFRRACSDPARHLLIFERQGEPAGFVSFTRIEPRTPVADWGFYVAPSAAPGTGKALGKETLRYAFEHISLHKLCGQVLAYNDKSIRFHERLGFAKEGLLRQQYFDGTEFHDVIHFGLLADEWKAAFGGLNR